MTLVSTDWLNENLGKIKIIDASWHLETRDGQAEYKKEHIPNSVFFDLEKSSKQDKNLPHGHFLPEKERWELEVSEMGISNNDTIVIYDNSFLMSACRCWFQFIYYGHAPKLVHVLDGGFEKWKSENKKISTEKTKIIKSKYYAKENKNMVKNKLEIKNNIEKKEFILVDARSKNRFLGLEPEPRPNVRSGSIENSKSLPFLDLINNKYKTLLPKKNLEEKFSSIGLKNQKNVVFTCGSSVTASVLGLAYKEINNNYTPTIYVGSWSEYGKIK